MPYDRVPSQRMSRRTNSDDSAPGTKAIPIITAVAASVARNPNGYMSRARSPPTTNRTTQTSSAASPNPFLR